MQDWVENEDLPSSTRATAERTKAHLSNFFIFSVMRADGASVSWQSALTGSSVVVIQLKGLDPKIQKVITEFLLWDLYAYCVATGPKSLGSFVVLDEAHNLDFGDETPVDKIVREARKFGLVLILASQQPAGFSPSAFANTASKLVFQTVDEKGRIGQKLASKCRNMRSGAAITDLLAKLPKRNAFFLSENKGQVVRVVATEERL